MTTAGFSIADILMADVLRLVDRFDGLPEYPVCRDYVAHATARPSFVKAHVDQMRILLRQTEEHRLVDELHLIVGNVILGGGLLLAPKDIIPACVGSKRSCCPGRCDGPLTTQVQSRHVLVAWPPSTVADVGK